MNSRVCICIAGWHFPETTFRALNAIQDVDIYLVSHKPKTKIPAHVFEVLPENKIYIEPNYGYDWGCYQQFLERRVWRSYSHVAFMHDDIVIKRPDLISAGLEHLREHSVVGNYRPAPPSNWPASHPESYFHSSWRPNRETFSHDIVRGSFFMTTTKALEALESFEVFWDRFHAAPYFGNWSLRASCAKWQDRCGPNCFGFLSEQHLESDYLVEMVRGLESHVVIEKRSRTQNVKAHLIYVLTRHYMLRTNMSVSRKIVMRALARSLRYAASRPAQ